jgi:hypothetical protein
MAVQAKAGASKKVLVKLVDYVLNVTEGLDPVYCSVFRYFPSIFPGNFHQCGNLWK